MAQVVRPLALLTRYTARSLTAVHTSSTASATFPSLSSQCLRLQCRFYASKQKATKRLSQASPKSTQSAPSAPTPARQRQPQSQAPATGATNYVEPMSLFIHTVAQRPSPTLLYLAPTSNAHPISCLGVAGFSIAYGVYHFYDAFLVSHPGLWIPTIYMLGGVSVFMIGIGTWVGLGALRLVGSLSAVPARLATKSAGAEGIVVRMEPRKILPFLLTKPIECKLSELRLANRVTPMVKGDDMRGRMIGRAERRSMLEKKEDERERMTLGGVLVRPFGNLVRNMSGWIGRLVGREGFASLYVNGKAWKIDARSGYLLDDGVALDRLLKAR